MRRIVLSLLAVLLFPLMVSAQDANQIQIDQVPMFANSKNGNANSLDEYMTNNIIYPIDQMKHEVITNIRGKILISSEGKVKGLEVYNKNVLDSFKKEIYRVLSKTEWTPAMSNGRYISIWQDLNIYINLFDTNYMPSYIGSTLRKVKRFINNPTKYPSGMKNEEYKQLLEKFSNVYAVYPISSEINDQYARMLISDGRFTEAHEALSIGARDTSNYILNTKTNVLGLLLSSMLYDKERYSDKAKLEYSNTQAYISKLFFRNNLGRSIIQEDEAYKDRHARQTLNDFDNAIQRNTTDWYYKQKVENEWSLNKIYDISAEMERRGLLSSGAVKQNTAIIYNLYKSDYLKADDFFLLAIRSLVTRLSEGEDMEKAQLINMIADEKVSDKVRKQLQGLYDQVEALKLSKDEIVNNVIMYAPVQDPSKTKEENEAAAAEFYRIRDAINNVYHLDWLEKK